jgi:hypothetical protein
MPKLHMSKVAYGCRDLESLQRRNAERSVGGERRVPTRMLPRRAEELIGGNLYWIVKHRIIAGQRILGFEGRPDGRIDIVCSAELESVAPRHCRAHQGWRYVEQEFAPVGDDDGTGLAELPPRLYGTLASLTLV